MLRKLFYSARQKINFSKVTSCGKNSTIGGRIEKRSSSSIITIGHDCLINGRLVTETENSEIHVGNNVFLGADSILDSVISIIIEDDVLISYRCILADSNNHSLSYSTRKKDLANWKKGEYDWSTTKSNPIRISKGVWIGMNSIILKGVMIGQGSVVGAGSVVTKDIPPWTIAAGNPARIIREILPNER